MCSFLPRGEIRSGCAAAQPSAPGDAWAAVSGAITNALPATSNPRTPRDQRRLLADGELPEVDRHGAATRLPVNELHRRDLREQLLLTRPRVSTEAIQADDQGMSSVARVIRIWHVDRPRIVLYAEVQ